LSGVRTVVDWPRICVDPLVERAVVDGFRLPGQTDTDTELWEFWQSNNMDSEFPLTVQDALTFGRGYVIVGRGDDGPLITVGVTVQPGCELGSADEEGHCRLPVVSG
jgi:hypothetical protein